MRLVGFALVGLFVATSLAAHSSSSDSRADSYVLRLGEVTYMNGKGMSGEALERIQKAYGRRFFWFRRRGKTYLVTNAGELERAEAIILPQSELGRKQAALGSKQSELGSQQASLGSRQAQIGLQQAGARDDSRHAELSKQQQELSEKQNKLGKAQDDLGRQQELSEKQNKLGKAQDDLGRQQERLGDMQERLSRQIEKQLGDLTDQWIRTGEAKELGR